jgi:putative C-S lyase
MSKKPTPSKKTTSAKTRSRLDFDSPVERAGTWSTRWERYAGRDVIPLWVADTDFRAPPVVLQALRERLDHGVLGYTAPPPELRVAIVERMARLYRWRIEPSWIVFIPGLVPGLHHAARTLVPPQGRVLVPKPVYQHIRGAPALAGWPITDLPLVLQRGRWVYDLDAVKASASGRTAAFFLCNPQNPGGTVFTQPELASLAEATGDALIISDEIHCDLILDSQCRHVPIASLSPEVSRRTVTLMSPNKTFNFPSAGCAWAIIEDAALRKAFAVDVDAHYLPSASVFGYLAALEAYRGGEEWLAAQIEYLRGNRDLVEKEIGLPMAHVEATYLAWIDCSRLGLDNPAEHFLKHGVALSPGAQFGEPRFVRLNFGTQRKILEQALARIRTASTRSPRG